MEERAYEFFMELSDFSEDMDFSLLEPDADFHIEDYFPSIINEFAAAGKDVVISKKEKRLLGRVESAFLKENTEIYNLKFQTEKSIKIKIEVDIDPPLNFESEQKLLLLPYSFMTRCFSLPDLYAGKMHALAFRQWKSRVKGRDWYDFEWYVRKGAKLDFKHLQTRIEQFNHVMMSREEFLDKLKDRLINTDIESVKRDVAPFIKNNNQLEIWTNDYFVQLMNMIKFL